MNQFKMITLNTNYGKTKILISSIFFEKVKNMLKAELIFPLFDHLFFINFGSETIKFS